VTGLTLGEGCFFIKVRPKPKMNTGYSVELVFKLVLLDKDNTLIEKLLSCFGVGAVTSRIDDAIVGSLSNLEIIINHFDSYPLISQK